MSIAEAVGGYKNNSNATVEAYVAAMKKKDSLTATTAQNDDEEQERDHVDDGPEESRSPVDSGDDDGSTGGGAAPGEDPAVVGVKSHGTHKKSNAVGDPDGDDDGGDGDSDDSLSDFSDEWEEMEGLPLDQFVEDVMVEPQQQQLHVEVELVEENDPDAVAAHEELLEDNDADAGDGKPSGGGGVGVRLGRMNSSRRANRRNSNSWRRSKSLTSGESSKLSNDQKRLLDAWAPHVYFPPSPSALAYLTDHARLLDASSKTRLDRRTLYAGLLIEWGSAKDTKRSTSSRKFLPPAVSQTLQAALSMATQPQWRQSAPRTSGIRLYQEEDHSSTGKPATLAMQETVAMALVSRVEFCSRFRACQPHSLYLCISILRLIPWDVDSLFWTITCSIKSDMKCSSKACPTMPSNQLFFYKLFFPWRRMANCNQQKPLLGLFRPA